MIEILQAHSLTATGYIQAESMGVTEKERSSTASIIEEMTTEKRETGTWIRDGKSRIWRISRIEENPVAKTRTLQLETIFQILKDRIIPQEITAADMGGSDSCTAAQALRAILGYQSDWILGACDYTDSNPYSFSGEDLLSAVETVLTSLEEPWLEFDVSRYPFVVNVRKASQTPQCEMRMSRNIVSMRKSIDMSRMFTRFYPVGKEDLRLPGAGYMSRNERAYGIREKSATDQSRETVEALRSWATEQLYKHARPDVTITINGIELAAATGESLDRLTVGTVCRVPLPEFGTSENERIIQKSWADELNRPEDVTVTLGNEIQDVARILKQEVTGSASTAVRSGRAGSKKAKEDHAWFVDTTDHVSMVAEAVAGPGASKDWSRVAEITVDGKGIHQRVTETEGNVVKHEARIEVSERAIVQEVKDRSRQGQELSAKITVTADKITQDVANKTAGLSTKIEQTATSIRTEVKDTAAGLQSSIDQQRDRISLVVEGTGANAKIRPAQIVASINESGSNILLDADKIKIAGTTTIADVMTVQNGYVHINAPLLVSSGDSGHELMYVNGTLYVNRVAANSVEVPYHYSTRRTMNVVDAQVSGNTLTITYVDGTTANFNKAASLTGSWSGAIYTAKATPGTAQITIGFNSSCNQYLVVQGGSESVSWTTITKGFNVQTQDNSTSPPSFVTRFSGTLSVNGSEVFENGKKDASVSIHSVEWESISGSLPTSRDLNIMAWNVSNNSKKASKTVGFRLYKSGNTVYLQDNSSGSWVSRCMI